MSRYPIICYFWSNGAVLSHADYKTQFHMLSAKNKFEKYLFIHVLKFLGFDIQKKIKIKSQYAMQTCN